MFEQFPFVEGLPQNFVAAFLVLMHEVHHEQVVFGIVENTDCVSLAGSQGKAGDCELILDGSGEGARVLHAIDIGLSEDMPVPADLEREVHSEITDKECFEVIDCVGKVLFYVLHIVLPLYTFLYFCQEGDEKSFGTPEEDDPASSGD